jgi:adenine-specific DNA-methyltransferase
MVGEGKRVVFANTYCPEFDVLIAHNDAMEFLSTVPSETVQLVVSSPPYNIGKPYESRRELEEYLAWQLAVLRECVRVLKPGGSLCWEVGNYVEQGEVYPLDVFFYRLIREEIGLRLRNRVIWHFEHGLHAKRRFSGRYEVVLWFTKGDSYTFNLDAVRVPQKYPGKRHYKGPNKGKPSANPLGKNPGDLWAIVAEDWEREIWDIPNVKANHPEKTIHPCQFPIELVERLVLALTVLGDVVLDPFMGVGSTLIAALLHGRRAVGVDKEEAYVQVARNRILQALQGTLKRRPLGKPKYEPRGTEKVTQIPLEWKERNQ